MKLTAHLHRVPKSKNEWNCTSSPTIRLHGVVLSYSTGTTLPYHYLHLEMATLTYVYCNAHYRLTNLRPMHIYSTIFSKYFRYRIDLILKL
jgi:hypothetical protein